MSLTVTTYNDLIVLALKNAGVIGVGQTASATDINDACMIMNDMIAEFQRRRYLIYHLVDQSITATGAESYTVGPGGDFAVAERPAVINAAYARQNVSSNPSAIDYPLEILPARETYAQIALKSLESFPRWAYYDAAYPQGNFFVYPVITSQFDIHIVYPALLQTAVALTDPVTMPPEYRSAVRYNLAVRLADHFQLNPSPVLIGLARSALDTVRLNNTQVPRMKMPRGLLNPPRYNIFSDSAY